MAAPNRAAFIGVHLPSIIYLCCRRSSKGILWQIWLPSWLLLTLCSEILTDESREKISQRSRTNPFQISAGAKTLGGYAIVIPGAARRRISHESRDEGCRAAHWHYRDRCCRAGGVLHAVS